MRTYLVLVLLPLGLLATGDRDFSGNWTLDRQQSDLRGLSVVPGDLLTISQQGATLRCTESGVTWSFRTDETESNYTIAGSVVNTQAKWEGAALFVTTMAGGPQSYSIEDRWELSEDGAVLTIKRTIRRDAAATQAVLVYRNRERQVPAEFVVEAGTKIPLSLVSSLDTKRSAQGDRVYLETAFPIALSGRIVIPKGSYVAGTVTAVKRAGKTKGKAELFLRFDSLTLPNGVTREFRSRLDSAGGHDVDRQEGKIQGDSDKAGDARTVGEAAGAGATLGSLAGLAGHGAMGTGIGALGGAAAGLAAVLVTRGPDLILERGTTLEMVLDRELRYEPRELVLQR